MSLGYELADLPDKLNQRSWGFDQKKNSFPLFACTLDHLKSNV